MDGNDCLDLLARVSRTGRRPRRDELEELRLLGERAAESGLGLRELIGGQLRSARAAWPELPGIAGAATAAEARRAGGDVLAALDAAVEAVVTGYQRAQRLAAHREETERREFVDDLLHGRSGLGRLAERADRFGLRLARTHRVAVAAVAEGPGFDDGHPVTRHVDRELTARLRSRHPLLATKEGRLVCVAPGGDRRVTEAFAALAMAGARGAGGAVRVAVGRPHRGPGGVAHSYEEALSALDTAERLGLAADLLDAAELMVFPVLLRDRAAMADLVRTVLGPLTGARGGAEPLLETLAAHAEAGYNRSETARRLSLSVRALTYRLARIRELTGYDPDDALHRYTLQTAALGARLLRWPEHAL
ncbi:regulator [Mangrovactinospora gilvigrisea]|uniref:Regulator n=1 Tax=Mangrovactinospora gilvigrisea TaxID=1428644 RepID=A0A1J7BHS5_9ACTN|nr:helix-turn-helix domain-containing protein [Mangrovactinospora gilvigrisea]OIV38206.1 regulator [Mangrovactinospora gilvigrisea]